MLMKEFKELLEKVLFSDNYMEDQKQTEDNNEKEGKHSN